MSPHLVHHDELGLSARSIRNCRQWTTNFAAAAFQGSESRRADCQTAPYPDASARPCGPRSRAIRQCGYQPRIARRTSASTATYMYRFDWPAADDDVGSPHGIDIPFAFDTIDVDGWDEFIDGPERAHLLAKAIQHAWAAFAHSGDPTSPNLPTWHRFDPNGRATMILGPRSHLVHDPRGPLRETWMAGAAV